MKFNLKKFLNILFMVATLVFILVVAFGNSELANAWETLFTLDAKWVLGAFLGWFTYLFFDALTFHFFLRDQKYPVPLLYSLFTALIGIYYSDITPGGGGGQPMQIYYLNKRKVPVGISTSCISMKLICSQFMIVLMAGIFWMFNREFAANQLGGVKWIIIFGTTLNFLVVPGMLLVAFHRPLVQSLVAFGIRVGVKLRLIKNPEQTTVHVDAVLDTYHDSILHLKQNPQHVMLQLALAGISLLGLMSVTVCVYHAFGLQGTGWHQIMTIAFLLFLSVSYTPMPGASGAQEGGFLVYYQGIFTAGTIGLALLVWRFITFYLFLILGAGITIVRNLLLARKQKTGATPSTEPSTPTIDAGAPPA